MALLQTTELISSNFKDVVFWIKIRGWLILQLIIIFYITNLRMMFHCSFAGNQIAAKLTANKRTNYAVSLWSLRSTENNVSPEAILTRASSSCIKSKACFRRASVKSSDPRLFSIRTLDPINPPCFASQPRSVDSTNEASEFWKSVTLWESEEKFEVSFNFSSKTCSPLSLSNLVWLQSRDKMSSIVLSAILDIWWQGVLWGMLWEGATTHCVHPWR